MPPHLIWNGSTTGRKLFKDEVFQQWQLLNHFPRSGVIGSKSGLLWNLRDHCACEAKMPLMSFLPRSYDLRSSRELRGFLLDFAVTKAEAMLSEASTVTTPSLPVASGLLQACRLLGRLSCKVKFCVGNVPASVIFRRASDLLMKMSGSCNQVLPTLRRRLCCFGFWQKKVKVRRA
eukprot:symbB.v1.2.012397.t1/scaffold857.1/size218589/12